MKVPVEALGGSVGVKPLLPALAIVSKYKPEAASHVVSGERSIEVFEQHGAGAN
jgi:hypothetical protein